MKRLSAFLYVVQTLFLVARHSSPVTWVLPLVLLLGYRVTRDGSRVTRDRAPPCRVCRALRRVKGSAALGLEREGGLERASSVVIDSTRKGHARTCDPASLHRGRPVAACSGFLVVSLRLGPIPSCSTLVTSHSGFF